MLVAAQINFEEIGNDVTHKQAREVQKIVGTSWTRLQAAPQMRATLTPAGPLAERTRSAYLMQSADEQWSAVVSPDSVTLETRRYEGWADMSAKIGVIAGAVATVFDPSQCLRFGLRYINQVSLPDIHESWDGLIPASLLSLISDSRFSSSIMGSDQRHLLQLDANARCMLHHGLLADPEGRVGKSYLLDYDVFSEDPQVFAAEQVLAIASELHSHAGALFRASIEDELYQWLKG